MIRSWLNKPGSILVIILLAGLALRMTMVLQSGNTLLWEDEADYMQLAEHLIHGEGYTLADGTPTAFRAPGYPVLLAAAMTAGIRSVAGLKMINVLLGTITIWMVYRLCCMMMDTDHALLAAAITAIYPYYIYMPSVLLATTWFTLLLLAATWFTHRAVRYGRRRDFLGSGLFFGAAALVRPSGLVLLLAALVWMVFAGFKIKRILRRIPLTLVAALVLVLPWMARNAATVDSFSLTTNAWRNIWLGNNPAATVNSGSNISLPPDMEQALAARTEKDKEALYREKAMEYIGDHPARFAWLSLQKGLALWRPTPGESTETETDSNPWLRWISILSVGPVMILALTALFTAPDDFRKEIMLWFFYAILFTLLHAVIISKVRFRLPLDVYMIISAVMAGSKVARELIPNRRASIAPGNALGGGGV